MPQVRKDYTTLEEIWGLFLLDWPSGAVREIGDLYVMVEASGLLQPADWGPARRSNGTGVRWQRNVQNVLKHHTDDGDLEWITRGRYRMG